MENKWKSFGIHLYREIWLEHIQCPFCKEIFIYDPDDDVFVYCPYCGEKIKGDGE